MRDLLSSAKALSDPTRLRIVHALRGGELCVCELSECLGVLQSTLSTHLQFLRQAQLVDTRNEGRWIYYQLAADFAATVDALFAVHRAGLEKDATLRKDATRLKKLRANPITCPPAKSKSL
jgi:ArsR family transcriptional regulator